jgi:hypothetical protein
MTYKISLKKLCFIKIKLNIPKRSVLTLFSVHSQEFRHVFGANFLADVLRENIGIVLN